MKPLTKKDILTKLGDSYRAPLADEFLKSTDHNILLDDSGVLSLEDKLVILRVYGHPIGVQNISLFWLFLKDHFYHLPKLLQKTGQMEEIHSLPYHLLNDILYVSSDGLQVSPFQDNMYFTDMINLLEDLNTKNNTITNKKLISAYIQTLFFFRKEEHLILINDWLKRQQRVLDYMKGKYDFSKFHWKFLIEKIQLFGLKKAQEEWLQKDTSEKQAIRVQLAKEEQTENSSERTSAYFAYQQKYIDLVNAIDQYLKSDNSLSSLKNDFDLLNQQEFGLLDLSDAFSPAKNMGSLWLGSEEANKIPTLKNLIELYEELWNYRLFYPLDRVKYIDEIASEANQLLS